MWGKNAASSPATGRVRRRRRRWFVACTTGRPVRRLEPSPSCVVLLLALAASCGQSVASTAEDTPAAFPLAQPTTSDVVIERAYVAEIRAARYAEVRTRLKGILEAVSVDEGQQVTAGQPLFTVNARTRKQEVLVARAAIHGVQAELRAAELDVENTRGLRDRNVVSAAELAVAQSKVEMLRAKLEEAKANAERASAELAHAQITAPFDGVVNRIPRKAGSAVGEDELLTTITDTRDVHAYFRLTEREYLELLGEGAPAAVALRLADGRAFAAEGVIDAVASEFDRETGSLAYRARFANPGAMLKHGSSGKVIVRRAIPNALLVPQRATFDIQGDLYAYVVDDKSVARARKLVVKARHGDAFVVERGLAAGERFVLDGVQKVKDGMTIAVAQGGG